EENVAEVEQLGKQARTQVDNQSYSDEQQRLGAQQKMDQVQTGDAQRSADEAAKNVQSGKKLDDLNRSIRTESQSVANQKQESIYNAKEKIDQVEAKKPEKAIIKNSLGEEYPEGVTEEVFQRKDENGILSAI